MILNFNTLHFISINLSVFCCIQLLKFTPMSLGGKGGATLQG